jgi:hypothetical protein
VPIADATLYANETFIIHALANAQPIIFTLAREVHAMKSAYKESTELVRIKFVDTLGRSSDTEIMEYC